MANDRLDIIIFGATGFTGKYAVKHAAHFCKEWKLNFGIAGRRKEALEAVLKEYAPDAENVPIILADVDDEESLKKMTERTKVLATCCGPYRFCGEAVVKACIATRTHYVDITAESQFIENMQLLYNKAAQEAGVYIVSACGFESIPSEMGIIFTQRKFEGEVNSIETYALIEGNITFLSINYTTWESAVYVLAHWDELKVLRAKLYPNKLPEFEPKLKSRNIIHKSDVSGYWSMIYPVCDGSVALHTQRFLYDEYNERPVQIRTYISFKSFFFFLAVLIFCAVFGLMTCTAFTRKLLLKYPVLFSFGIVGRENMSHKLFKDQHFSITFKALGWSAKSAEPTNKHTYPPNKELITRVNAFESAYDITGITLILSMIMILKEADKMPDNGVLTPGAAFGKTSLIQELEKNDIKFEVIKSSEN